MTFYSFQFRPQQAETYSEALPVRYQCNNDIRGFYPHGMVQLRNVFMRCAATMDEVMEAMQ